MMAGAFVVHKIVNPEQVASTLPVNLTQSSTLMTSWRQERKTSKESKTREREYEKPSREHYKRMTTNKQMEKRIVVLPGFGTMEANPTDKPLRALLLPPSQTILKSPQAIKKWCLGFDNVHTE
jgi:hypothetical protein